MLGIDEMIKLGNNSEVSEEEIIKKIQAKLPLAKEIEVKSE